MSDQAAGMAVMKTVHGSGGVLGRYQLTPELVLTAVAIRHRNSGPAHRQA